MAGRARLSLKNTGTPPAAKMSNAFLQSQNPACLVVEALMEGTFKALSPVSAAMAEAPWPKTHRYRPLPPKHATTS